MLPPGSGKLASAYYANYSGVFNKSSSPWRDIVSGIGRSYPEPTSSVKYGVIIATYRIFFSTGVAVFRNSDVISNLGKKKCKKYVIHSAMYNL